MGNQIVGTTSVEIFTSNPDRASITLRNESTGGQIIRLSYSSPVGLNMSNTDYVLRPTEEKNFLYEFDGIEMRGQVSAIADAAGAILVKAETSFKKQ